jgi:putative FmdB family regulatory protein
MPIYEYKCKKCGKIFEYKQRITDEALTHCPAEICEQEEKGKGEVYRIISSNVGLVFKGSGFYLTDYAKKNGSNATPKNGKPKTNGSTKKETIKTEKSGS